MQHNVIDNYQGTKTGVLIMGRRFYFLIGYGIAILIDALDPVIRRHPIRAHQWLDKQRPLFY